MRVVLIASACVFGTMATACAFRVPEGRLACTAARDCPPGWVCEASRCYSSARDAASSYDAAFDAALDAGDAAGIDAALDEDGGRDDAGDGATPTEDAGRDAGLADAGPACTTGPDGHCYVLVPAASTWASAGSTCAALGGHLVAIGTASEQAVAWTVSMPAAMPAWIGATDEGTEGAWRWTTGGPFSARWGTTQPDNAGGSENCAALWPGFDGAWADVSCSSSFPAVCEIP